MATDNSNQISAIFSDFLQSYLEKDAGVSNKEWLISKFKEQALDLAETEIENYAGDLAGSVKSLADSVRSLEESKACGIPAEEWLKEKIKETGKEIIAEKIQEYNESLEESNTRLLRNLKAEENGQIVNATLTDLNAEKQIIDGFNTKAAAAGEHYEAIIEQPDENSIYGRNLFDVSIIDKLTGEKLEYYQIIFGNTLQETIDLVNETTSAGQFIIVPEDMVEAVSKACPFKDIVATLGGTGRIPIVSEPLCLVEVVENSIKKPNTVAAKLVNNPEETLKDFANNAFLSGVLATGLSAGLERLAERQEVEDFNASDLLGRILLSNETEGIKTAVAGALATAAHKGLVKAIPKNVPPVVVSGIASVGVENLKVFADVAEGNMTLDEGLEHMGNINIAMSFEFVWNKFAAPVASKLLALIPVVGPYISNDPIAKMILERVKEPVKKLVIAGVKRLVPVVKSVAKTIYSRVKTAIANSVKNMVKNALASF